MAVWTRGSAGWVSASWMRLAARFRAVVDINPGDVIQGVDDEAADAAPEELRDDLALSMPVRPSGRQEAFWRDMQRSRILPRF
ncbi:hypothetical protein AAIH46_03785 [Rhizobium sp. 0TCS1.26]|uniref:hypothetical protein n=1 Tax=Rhizobium sp. 0TCS1.26 TaxID=3142623 RepID=UPI003D28E3C4